MKAILSKDRIVKFCLEGGVEVGNLPAKGIGLERLRFDGEKLVDIASIHSELWVEYHNGVFLLHVKEFLGCQKVEMTYADRKRLYLDADGGIKVHTPQEQQELEEKEARESQDLQQLRQETINMARNLRQETINMARNLTCDKVDQRVDSVFSNLNDMQRGDLKTLFKAVLWLAKQRVKA